MARNCRAQHLTDHWPAVTYVRLPEHKEKWQLEGNSGLKGWRPKTASDESGFRRMIVEELEAVEDVMGVVSIEDITESISRAARAAEFEAAGGRNRWMKKTKAHLETEKKLRRKTGEELKEAKRNLTKKKEEKQSQRNLTRGAEGEKQK